MKVIHIKQKGFLINTGAKLVRTPLLINCEKEKEELILSQIKKLNIVYWEISEAPGSGKPKAIETKSPEDIEPDPVIEEDIINSPEDIEPDPVIEEDIINSPEDIEPIIDIPSELAKKYILNYRKDNLDDRDHTLAHLSPSLLKEALNPENFIDYTDEMSPIKNQAELGSCVGFAVVAMKEWQEQQEHLQELSEGKKYKRRPKNYDLSEQWLYYKCKEIDYWPDEEGTSIRFAMQTLHNIGVPCEQAWPYNTKQQGKPESWSTLVARWSLGGEYTRLTNPEEIIISLGDNGPVPIGVGVFLEMFYADGTGMIDYPKDPNTVYGGHAICLVGWNPETKLFKFKNSWGTDWGQDGYGYLSYDYIKDFCWDAWQIKDLNVTKEMLKG